MARRSTRAIAERRCLGAVILLLSVHALLLVWIDCHASPNQTEVGHMGAGIATWQRHRFDAFRVNPPLVRMIATAPLVSCFTIDELTAYSSWPHDRCEWALGVEFLSNHSPDQIRWFFALARCAVIPLSLLGGFFCFRLSAEIFGTTAGVVALGLWCFSPMVLGWGATICPDVAAAAFAIGATYALFRWLQKPAWDRVFLVGLGLGLAALSKFTLLILFPLFPALWLQYRCPGAGGNRWILRESLQLSTVLILGLLTINVGYCFEDSLRPLKDYEFQSELFGGTTANDDAGGPANSPATSWFDHLVVPLPAAFMQGIDSQRFDFEKGMPSYLRGQWAETGWWYYYLYSLAIKVPLGTWCLAALALAVTILVGDCSVSRRDEVLVVAPLVMIVAFVSSQTGFSLHPRYIIPALPFLFVWISKVGRLFDARKFTLVRLAIAFLASVALAWSLVSSLIIFPHSLSYFNELAIVLPTPHSAPDTRPGNSGNQSRCSLPRRVARLLTSGPCHGPRHLLGSNVDWGQDLFYLKDWLASHPGVTLSGADYGELLYPATLLGIPETSAPPPGPDEESRTTDSSVSLCGPKPGWYAMSVNSVYRQDGRFRYFLRLRPVARQGYSIYVYHITLKEANRVRHELGLGELPPD